jgi:hypothetical protein
VSARPHWERDIRSLVPIVFARIDVPAVDAVGGRLNEPP